MSSSYAGSDAIPGFPFDPLKTDYLVDTEEHSPRQVEVVINLDIEPVKELHPAASTRYALYYYPYSSITSILLAFSGFAIIVFFFLGMTQLLFVGFWLIIIGLGMYRTLYIAGKERARSDEGRLGRS